MQRSTISGLGSMDLEAFRSATGAGVRVLVIDSGVEVSHPALAGCAVPSWRIEASGPRRSRVLQCEPGDRAGHGTAVAGIIHEIAPQAELHSLQILGEELRTSSHIALDALEWAVGKEFDLVNCSFGSSAWEFTLGYKRVVDQAFCQNVLVVAACNNFDFKLREYPACFPTVLATGFGEWGDPLELQRVPGQLVEFLARGAGVRVAWKGGQYLMSTGSSFAAAHLTGIVARLRQLRPGWNACEMKTGLYALAKG